MVWQKHTKQSPKNTQWFKALNDGQQKSPQKSPLQKKPHQIARIVPPVPRQKWPHQSPSRNKKSKNIQKSRSPAEVDPSFPGGWVLLVSAETSRSHPPGNEGSTSAGLTCSRQDIMLEGCSQPPPPIREGSSRDICWFPRKPADLRLAQGSASLEIRRGLLIIFIWRPAELVIGLQDLNFPPKVAYAGPSKHVLRWAVNGNH